MAIFQHLIDLIYPPRCHICGEFLNEKCFLYERDGLEICDRCFQKLPLIRSPKCPVCSLPLPAVNLTDHLCYRCLIKPPHFEKIFSPFMFKNGLRDAIHNMKYNGRRQIADTMGRLLSMYVEPIVRGLRYPLIIPVPLHKKRLRERGYNQSVIIAGHISRHFEIALDFDTLIRGINNGPQAELPMKERIKNVKNAFSVNGNRNIKGKEILMVDDVATTGSTLNECARVLLKAGAKRVLCVVVARATLKQNIK